MRAFIPRFDKMAEQGKQAADWWSKGPSMFQAIVPEEPLPVKGIDEGSTVLVFAGSTGEIAKSLNVKKFFFTDITKRRLQVAKERYEKEFQGKTEFVLCNANFIPLKDNSVDFSFSFEPYPLIEYIPYFILELIRVSRKGIIFMWELRSNVFKQNEQYVKKLIEICGDYGLQWKASKAELEGRTNETTALSEKKKLKLRQDFFTITETAKELAKTDQKIVENINKIFESKGEVSPEDLKKIKEELKLDDNGFGESLKRITKMKKFMMDYPAEPHHLEITY